MSDIDSYEDGIDYVYFLQCLETGRIKIGTSSRLQKRVSDICCCGPTMITFLGAILGDNNKERELHALLKDSRAIGEWFNLTTEVNTVLQTLGLYASSNSISEMYKWQLHLLLHHLSLQEVDKLMELRISIEGTQNSFIWLRSVVERVSDCLLKLSGQRWCGKERKHPVLPFGQPGISGGLCDDINNLLPQFEQQVEQVVAERYGSFFEEMEGVKV